MRETTGDVHEARIETRETCGIKRQAGRQAEARLATTGAKSSLAKLKMKFESSNQQVNHTRRTRSWKSRSVCKQPWKSSIQKAHDFFESAFNKAIINHQAVQI